MEYKLAIFGRDGTASITGKYNGCIRRLEELLNKPLQWIVCLLHTNELLLRHVLGALDSSTSGPDAFAGPIEKNCMGLYQVGQLLDSNLCQCLLLFFPILPEQVVCDLSSDQVYAYNWALKDGRVDDDLAYLEM